MYNFLTEALKRRLIEELRKFWIYHPRYPDLANHIQGKFSFRERPQQGIILKTSSANHVQLSADNYLGVVNSYVQLAKYEDNPGLSIEWVTEDDVAIRENGGVFPSPPGIYYITVLQTESPYPPNNAEPSYEFEVDPLLDALDVVATKVDDFTYAVENPYLALTTRVYEMPGSIPYVRDVNYTEDAAAGRISVVNPLEPGTYLLVSYRYPAPITGPWQIKENFAHKKAIPGVSLAFGRRVRAGDIMAVVVTDRRQPSALEYGGKWDISIDFDIMARDVLAQQEIADATVMYLWGIARNRLSTEGIEITTVSMGGESEEVYDETGDDYYYNASFSVQTQTDWSIHVPLTATIRRVVPLTSEQIAEVAGMTDIELIESGVANNIEVLTSLGLRSVQDPFFSGRTLNFETIK